MVWSLALRSDDAKQDPVVYGTKFSVVFLAEGPRTASIQEKLEDTETAKGEESEDGDGPRVERTRQVHSRSNFSRWSNA